MRLRRIALCVPALAASVALTPAFALPQHGHGAPAPHPAASPHPPETAVHSAPVPVPQTVTTNPALAARLQPLLPSGTTIATAATGFKNVGQFVAALHVSRNLGIPFAQLKAEMTGPHHDSLGQAIQELRPTADVKAAAKTADRQAQADIKASRAAKTVADADKDKK